MCNLSEVVLEEGRGLEREKIAVKLLRNHISYELISDSTELTIGEIKEIEKRMSTTSNKYIR